MLETRKADHTHTGFENNFVDNKNCILHTYKHTFLVSTFGEILLNARLMKWSFLGGRGANGTVNSFLKVTFKFRERDEEYVGFTMTFFFIYLCVDEYLF